jgi:hypothetical protein
LSVFPNRGHKLQTTRSWQFIGLERVSGEVPEGSPWEVARYGEDAIIANLDSGEEEESFLALAFGVIVTGIGILIAPFLMTPEGVWPESMSFNDGEMGPIPDDWKGICQNEHDREFRCNRLLLPFRTQQVTQHTT